MLLIKELFKNYTEQKEQQKEKNQTEKEPKKKLILSFYNYIEFDTIDKYNKH